MVISIKKEVGEIAQRKLCELKKKDPRFKQYVELHMKRIIFEKDTPTIHTIKPQVRHKSFGMGSGCTPACVGQSILDILARRPKLFTFKEACAILAHCNVILNHWFIEDVVRRYGIVIFGLPECPEEDLALAVFFFIEDMFGVQPKIEICTKLIEEDMVGVVFESITTKQRIAEKLGILAGSGIEIDTYFDTVWIENCLSNEDSDSSVDS